MANTSRLCWRDSHCFFVLQRTWPFNIHMPQRITNSVVPAVSTGWNKGKQRKLKHWDLLASCVADSHPAESFNSGWELQKGSMGVPWDGCFLYTPSVKRRFSDLISLRAHGCSLKAGGKMLFKFTPCNNLETTNAMHSEKKNIFINILFYEIFQVCT